MVCHLVGAKPLSEPMLIEPLGTNFSEILIKILTFSFKKMHLKMSSAKWRLIGLGLDELNGDALHFLRFATGFVLFKASNYLTMPT